MDFITLHPANYNPQDMVEGYTSLIWTERYLGMGQFEMRSPLISQNMAKLSTELGGTLVSLLDTREIMRVENHSIQENDEGVAELVTTGRTYDSILDYRAFYPENPEEGSEKTASDRAFDILVHSIFANPVLDADELAGVVVVDDVSATTPIEEWPTISNGYVGQAVRDILGSKNTGFRNIRPYPTGPYAGTIIFNIYDGTDLTLGNNPVVFRYDAGHLLDPKYLISNKDERNTAYVYSSTLGFAIAYAPPWSAALPPTGYDRRVLEVDASDLVDFVGTADDALKQRGLIELAKHNGMTIVDAEVSPNAPYKYDGGFGGDYSLGDYVRVMADYGVSAKMMVTEFTRTEDEEGDRGFPTLSLPTT